jgi:hypothetical protein
MDTGHFDREAYPGHFVFSEPRPLLSGAFSREKTKAKRVFESGIWPHYARAQFPYYIRTREGPKRSRVGSRPPVRGMTCSRSGHSGPAMIDRITGQTSQLRPFWVESRLSYGVICSGRGRATAD